MQIKEINVNVAVTRNLGDYNSIKLASGASAILSDSDDPDEAYTKLWLYAENQVESKVQEAIDLLEAS